MAVFNVPNYLEKDGFGMSLNIRRGNPNPLDNSSVWTSFDEAQNYAKTSAIAYVGQIITVVEEIDEVLTATAYVIDNENGDLKEIGASTEDISIIPIGDNCTIKVAEDGTISLFGLDEIEEVEDENGNPITYQPRYENGKLTWVKVSSTTIEDVSSDINGLKSDVQKINGQIEDLNDKIDNLDIPDVPNNISAFNNDAGYQNASEVETLIANKIADINHAVFEKVETKPEVENAVDNVLYLVPKDDKYEIYAKINNEMVLIDDTDVDLTGYVKTEDLADYATDTEVFTWLSDYVAKQSLNETLLEYLKKDEAVSEESVLDIINNQGYISENALNTVLLDYVKTEDALTADDITSIIGTSFENKGILDLITEDNIKAWNKGEENVISLISNEFSLSDSKELSINEIAQEKVSGLLDRLNEIENNLTPGAQANVLEVITLNGTALDITNKTVNIPVATSSLLGVVMGSSAVNKVSVEEDGTMTVNSLNVDKLVQDENSYLVLNGGNASLNIDKN